MDNKAIVSAFLAAAAAGDRASMAAILAPDAIITEADSLPFGGTHVGLAGFEALVRRVFLLWRETRVEIERLIAEGEHVVVLATMHARSKADGAALRMPIAEIWQLEDGRVREIRPFYFDTQRFNEILGASAGGPTA